MREKERKERGSGKERERERERESILKHESRVMVNQQRLSKISRAHTHTLKLQAKQILKANKL